MFLGHGHERAERRAKLATGLTAVFMVVEIAAGLAFGSMALLADGIHMATHVGALGLAAGAYWLARRHAGDARFTFGSGKFGDLAAFASAIALGIAGCCRGRRIDRPPGLADLRPVRRRLSDRRARPGRQSRLCR